MLSYRHAFHAGNHADVLKHFVLVQLLRYLNQKDKPYWFIDTHAGAGFYELQSGFAAKNAEYSSGISALWSHPDIPDPVNEYLEVVRSYNPESFLKHYPGSPEIAAALLRESDRLRLFELHPADFVLLQQHFSGMGRRIKAEQTDGFAALKAILPPPPRRALVLIDPPYELKQDYRQVEVSLLDALKRFETGMYAIWYPRLQRNESIELPDHLKQLPINSWLNVSLDITKPSLDGFGMHGSGMFIINPPWTLFEILNKTMPWFVETLGDGDASFVIEHQVD